MNNTSNMREEEIAIEECIGNFYTIASLQGRIGYLLMSIHAVNPAILNSLLPSDPRQILWYNMLYGTAFHIYSRPNMRTLTTVHRTIFSVLGSLMFNYSAMGVFGYYAERLGERPYLMTFLGFITGRIMILHFLAYLYHVDARSAGAVRRDNLFDSMYN